LSRSEIVLVNGLRSNHYNLNYSLHRNNMVDAYLRNFSSQNPLDIFPALQHPLPKVCRLLFSFFKAIDISI
ncbi:hypothetical protein ALC56_08088, partial [Trachymyrmex septentrionalis]